MKVPVLLDAGKQWLHTCCRDISAGGISVETNDLQVGEEVDLYVELPSRVAVETRARVVRSEGKTVGLSFTELTQEARYALTTFCRTNRLQHRAHTPGIALAVPDVVTVD